MTRGACILAGTDGYGSRVVTAHGHGHAANSACQRTAAQKPGTMQRFDAGALAYAKFSQTLPLGGRQRFPVYLVDKGGLTQGKVNETHKQVPDNN